MNNVNAPGTDDRLREQFLYLFIFVYIYLFVSVDLHAQCSSKSVLSFSLRSSTDSHSVFVPELYSNS